MSNPLLDLKKLINTNTVKSFTAKVVSVEGQKIKVKLNTGNTILVWGIAKLNETVMISGKQIIAVIGQEIRSTVYVP